MVAAIQVRSETNSEDEDQARCKTCQRAASRPEAWAALNDPSLPPRVRRGFQRIMLRLVIEAHVLNGDHHRCGVYNKLLDGFMNVAF
jgi:hypothetical protein